MSTGNESLHALLSKAILAYVGRDTRKIPTADEATLFAVAPDRFDELLPLVEDMETTADWLARSGRSVREEERGLSASDDEATLRVERDGDAWVVCKTQLPRDGDELSRRPRFHDPARRQGRPACHSLSR